MRDDAGGPLDIFAHRCAYVVLFGSMVKRKNPAAVALGRKGGKATAKNLTPEQRADMARRAAVARWKVAKVNKTCTAKGE
jgi:hypothetical protein